MPLSSEGRIDPLILDAMIRQGERRAVCARAQTLEASQHPASWTAGILQDEEFETLWESLIFDDDLKDRALSQAVLNFTFRPRVNRAYLPLHGIIVLAGPPGYRKDVAGARLGDGNRRNHL